MLRTGLLLALLPACVPPPSSKGGDSGETGAPDIVVAPAAIDFGAVAVGETPIETVTVSNEGTESLQILSVELADYVGVYTVSAIGSILVPPGGSTTFNVTYTPETAAEGYSEIRIGSNDPDEPETVLPLSAMGLAPVIQLSPEARDFGTIYVGCAGADTITLSNSGNADLEITALDLVTSSTELTLDAMEDVNGPLPWTLVPGNSVEVSVDYAPVDDVADSAYLAVTSSDPFRPRTEASVQGTGAVYGTNTDTFEQSLADQVDILLIVDAETTNDRLQALADGAETFFTALDRVGADYQVAVVSADDGCVIGETVFLTRAMTRADEVDAFYGWLTQISTGTYTRQGFTILEAATSSANLADCNAGLVRGAAKLAIVGVTDSTEQSANPWSYYVSLLQTLKTDPDDIRIHAIAGDYPSGCEDADGGQGWYEATVATGGTFLSICADADDTLTDLADAMGATPETFELSEWPVPETIVVVVDGVPVSGWTYSETNREIVFDESPEDGAVIEVTYATYGRCP